MEVWAADDADLKGQRGYGTRRRSRMEAVGTFCRRLTWSLLREW